VLLAMGSSVVVKAVIRRSTQVQEINGDFAHEFSSLADKSR
jgi:hypothetical protein